MPGSSSAIRTAVKAHALGRRELPYLMLFTGDPLPDVDRRSLAVEPMTCPPNAFRSGEALIRLEPGALVHEHVGDRCHDGSVIGTSRWRRRRRCRTSARSSSSSPRRAPGRSCRGCTAASSCPTVVLEIVLGILIGPEGLDLAEVDTHIDFLANLGLVFLFFFAGLELVEQRVARRSLVRGTLGWAISLAIGRRRASCCTRPVSTPRGGCSAWRSATTALGTLVPILADAGLLPTSLGSAVLGSGVAGEFWPIVVISIFLTGAYGASPRRCSSSASARSSCSPRRPRSVRARRGWSASSSRPCTRPVRRPCGCPSSCLAALVLPRASRSASTSCSARSPAGLVVGLALDTPEGGAVRMRLEGVGFGFLIPIYFVVTGMNFDLDSLLTPTGLGLAALFLALFVVVRGTPHCSGSRARAATDAEPRDLQRDGAAADRGDRGHRHGPWRDRRRRRYVAHRRRDDLRPRVPARRDAARRRQRGRSAHSVPGRRRQRVLAKDGASAQVDGQTAPGVSATDRASRRPDRRGLERSGVGRRRPARYVADRMGLTPARAKRALVRAPRGQLARAAGGVVVERR